MSETSSKALPHRLSVSSSSSQTRSQPQRPTPQQIVERITSPGTVLFQHSQNPPPGRLRTQGQSSRADMDNRRHPSSFQQLEKARSLGFLRSRLTVTSARRRNICHSLQGPQPANWRTRCAEGDPPRFRRRHTIDRNPRNQPDERTEAREYRDTLRCHPYREQADAGV